MKANILVSEIQKFSFNWRDILGTFSWYDPCKVKCIICMMRGKPFIGIIPAI